MKGFVITPGNNNDAVDIQIKYNNDNTLVLSTVKTNDQWSIVNETYPSEITIDSTTGVVTLTFSDDFVIENIVCSWKLGEKETGFDSPKPQSTAWAKRLVWITPTLVDKIAEKTQDDNIQNLVTWTNEAQKYDSESNLFPIFFSDKSKSIVIPDINGIREYIEGVYILDPKNPCYKQPINNTNYIYPVACVELASTLNKGTSRDENNNYLVKGANLNWIKGLIDAFPTTNEFTLFSRPSVDEGNNLASLTYNPGKMKPTVAGKALVEIQ